MEKGRTKEREVKQKGRRKKDDYNGGVLETGDQKKAEKKEGEN